MSFQDIREHRPGQTANHSKHSRSHRTLSNPTRLTYPTTPLWRGGSGLMGERIRRITAREPERLLKYHGFELVSQKGSLTLDRREFAGRDGWLAPANHFPPPHSRPHPL